VTPELDRRRGDAAVFTSAYAHAPATNLTLVALMHGIYPRVSFRPTTSQKPDIELRGLGEQLRQRGFASAFFSTVPLNYHRAGEFLAASNDFDFVEDPTRRAPLPGLPPTPWDPMAGTTDHATVESAIRWLEAQGDQPFAATIWTNQTHFPYLVAGETRALVDNPDFNRYLNGLAEIDRAFGRLMSWLDETGRARDTLVVVLGDHGEAFGQHRNYGHAGHVYEENIHIPLLLIQPGLFHGETYADVCGVVDIVPTVAEILRLPVDAGWQGRSLFSTQRTGRVYFFAAWSDFLMGYREGDVKKVYNAANDRHMIFDLAADPGESRNLAGKPGGGSTREVTQRVAAWVQHIEETYRPLLADE
jgi:arylsulfatase A-like enzyme